MAWSSGGGREEGKEEKEERERQISHNKFVLSHISWAKNSPTFSTPPPHLQRCLECLSCILPGHEVWKYVEILKQLN
jgi:hypothetical protein